MADKKRSLKDTRPLTDSVRIPCLGFGVYLSPESKCTASCLAALAAGYRHIDTAQYYENEREVGEAIRKSGLDRSEVFITTKILDAKGSIEKSFQSTLQSVRNIDNENGYVDLFLVHSALVGAKARKEQWLALEKLYHTGKARSIGVSNYGIGNIEEMKQYATVWPPHVNQLELHPWCQQKEIVAYCGEKGIVVEAYSPLVRNAKAEDPTLLSVATKLGVSTAQVLVRYSLQKNWIPLPKSDTPSRIAANSLLYDFGLSEEQMKALDALDPGAGNGSICHFVSNE